MHKPSAIQVYVAGTVVAAAGLITFLSTGRMSVPALGDLTTLLLVGLLLQFASAPLRGGNAQGSLVFVSHLTGGLLFGSFWGGVLAAIPAIVWVVHRNYSLARGLFNVSQLVLSVALTFLVYSALGGSTPPSILTGGISAGLTEALVEVRAFFVAALVYFVVNSLMVSAAVALASGKRVFDVWRTNTLWVLGYDVVASGMALLLALTYVRLRGAGALGLAALVVMVGVLLYLRNTYARLYNLQHYIDELHKAHEQLGQNVRDVLALMVKSIEARDPYTSGHSRRVGALAKAIAVEHGLSAEEIEKVENAALLHDVGKIHAEFAPLLAKDGRLTPEEWDIMKTHSVKSADLVSLFATFRGDVVSMVRHHHERWDGKGYPDGIASDAIPLGARIIMISDTIDAMSTDRPYRKALGFDVVVAELQKYSGVQFDPSLVGTTVRSMTVRRMVSEPEFLAERALAPASGRVHAIGPLRSQSSFWEGLRGIASSPGQSGEGR